MSPTADLRPQAVNVATYLPAMAARNPDQSAVIVPARRLPGGRYEYRQWTYRELEAVSNRYAHRLQRTGITRGMRTLVMVRPGIDFTAVIFALFKIGAPPVLIDPGMGIRRMIECIGGIRPEAFVAIPAAHLVRLLGHRAFSSVRHVATIGRRWLWRGEVLRRDDASEDERFEPANAAPDDEAAILFTSGSTGPAKGVVYEHAMFDAQVRMIRDAYAIQPGEIDLAAFPLFALFAPALGMTCVVPDMDPSRPATVDPARIVRHIEDLHVTNTFGSPAIWERVSRYCISQGIQLPTLKRVLIAGAPVSWRLVERMCQVLVPPADVSTPYGATEALPVSAISGHDILEGTAHRSRKGAGICVGRPLQRVTVRIVRIETETTPAPVVRIREAKPIRTPDAKSEPRAKARGSGGESSQNEPDSKNAKRTPRGRNYFDENGLRVGEIGEVLVASDMVTRAYAELAEATRLAKVWDGQRLWHRMGDVGYLDEQGRLWFCGRKAHRVKTGAGILYSVQCEAIFNEHADVARSALVGVGPRGSQRPVIVIEPAEGRFPRRLRRLSLTQELLRLAAANPLTRGIRDVLFHRGLPVDVRHNAKIDRERLAVWAARRLH